MSFPSIPDIAPNISIDRNQVINLLLASIAFEELGLAHIINAEAEKIQFVLGTLPGVSPPEPATLEDLLLVDKSVRKTLNTVIKDQMLLQFKLEDILEVPQIFDHPAVVFVAEVSTDNGVTWLNADTPPGPIVINGINPQFRFTVSNTGNVVLANVQVTDDVYGPIGSVPTIPPGASTVFSFIGIWAPGSQVHKVTITAEYEDPIIFTVSYQFYWVGVEHGVVGNTMFRFINTNSNNANLNTIQANDNGYGLVGTVTSIVPGASIQRPPVIGS